MRAVPPLYPSTLRDLLIRIPQAGLVQAKWTDVILDEVFRNRAPITAKDCPCRYSSVSSAPVVLNAPPRHDRADRPFQA